MPSISFNTTSVLALNTAKTLYKTSVPLDESASILPAQEALVYSTSAVAEGKPVPLGATYLKNADDTYFSIQRDSNTRLNLVTANGDLNLYVYSPPASQDGKESGSINQYVFDQAGKLKAGSTDNPISITNALGIAAAENTARLDLDGNGTIGGNVNLATGTLDKLSNFYKVKVAGQDLYIVDTPISKTTAVVDIAASVLKSNATDPWAPEEAYRGFTVIKSGSANTTTWDIYARKVTAGITTVTQFSFDNDRKLKSGFADGKVLSAQELGAIEKSSGINLNGDAILGATVESVDVAGGLYKGSLLNQDFYIIAPSALALKTGTTKATATDLSGALLDANGAWEVSSTQSIKSLVQTKNGSGAVIGADVYVKDTTDNQLKRFSFTKNSAGNFELNDNTGGAIDGIELAKQEKATTRDLNDDKEFGIKVGKALDTVGGLFVAEALGQKFLVASKSLVSNSKSVADLSSALTNADGTAWIPSEILSSDGIVAKNSNEGINIHVSSTTTAEVYVKKGSDFTKYEFTKAAGAPWVISGNSESMLAEEMVALEKTLKRDFNNDRFIGAVVYGTPIASGLYTAKYGNETTDLGNANPIYIYSSTKLALGNTVAANAKDFTSALKFSDSTYWKPTEGFNIKGAYVENGKYNIIATKGNPISPPGSPSAPSTYSVERYTFSLTGLELDANASTVIDAKELARVEKMQKADLNGDGITGVKAATNSVIDKVGLLFKVQAYDGIYFSTKTSASAKIEDLSQAFLNADGTAWEPDNFSDATTKLTLRKLTTSATESAPTQYEIYRSDGTAGNRTFSKYSFDANMKMIDSPTEMSLLEMTNTEYQYGRDINDDKIIGAKIEKVIDKNSGLYQVTVENKKFLVQSASSLVKTSSLENVLLDEDSNPIELNSNAQIVDDGVSYNVDSMFRKDANTIQVFASKVTGTLEYKNFEFSKKANGEFEGYFSLSNLRNGAIDTLTAKELVSLEKSSGRDINSDKSIGAKISTFSNDKSGQLYSAKILGDDYYFFAEKGRKIGSNIGTTTGNAVDFSKAFLDSEGKAWKPPVATGSEKWNIAGVVENKTSSTTTGYDIYVYQKAATAGDFNVKKYSWNADFVYQDENPVDAAALVKLETDEKRDFTGDGIIGFKIGLTPPAYQGVTRAKVMGGDSEDKFYIVGDFSKQIKQFGLSDALLNSAGTGAWILDDVKFKITSVVAGTGSTAGNRFVYAQNLVDSSMTRFTFNLSDGKYVSNSEVKLSDAQFAEEESKFKKDLNYDTRIGVASVENIRIDAKVSAPGGTLTNTGNTGNKSSGLTKASINSIDYLLVRDTPSATATTTLNKALMLSDGVTAWKPENNFHIKGVFNPVSGDTEIYGTMGPTGDLRKYVFEYADMPGASDAPLSLTGTAIPKVLKLKLVGGDTYSTVTQKDIAIREASATVGKDLNGDGAIGFQVSPSAAKVTTADGTTLTTTVVDAIYVLGKNTDKFGNSSTNTANSNALVEDDDADVATPNTFWKPQDGYQVKSINKISETEVHVLAGNTSDSDELIQYKFLKESGAVGWKLKEASTTLDTQAVVALETSLRRNMNADSNGSIGLRYSNQINTISSPSTVTGLISGSIGTKKYLFVGAEMATLGTTVKPFGLDNISGPNLLKKSDGSAWVLPATDTNINYFRSSTANDINDVPTTIKASSVRFTMEMNNTGKTYFDSDYKQLVPMLTKGTFAVATKNIDENRNGGFFVPETFVTATNNQALTFSASYKLSSSSTYGAVSTLSESNTNWLQFDPTSKMFSVKNPDNEFVGAYDIKVKATDAEGRYVEDKVFTLNINNTNDAPVALSANLPDLVATIGSPVASYVIPMTTGNETFSDVDVGDNLTFTATLADGTSLPSWLTFTSGSTISLSAASVPNDATAFTVRITATDSATIPKSVYKDLNVVINNQPYVELDDNSASTLIDKVATIGTAFTYDVSSIFTDDDATDTLTFAAKKSDGTDLPSWLLFNASTKTFSSSGNVPSTAQNLSVKVTVTDSKGSSKDDVFDITVNNAPVSVVRIDNKFFEPLLSGSDTFDITTDLLGAFADADTVADATLSFTFQVKKGSGAFGDDVPGELTRAGNIFTYTSDASGPYTIEVTAKDTRNSTVSSTFDVTIA